LPRYTGLKRGLDLRVKQKFAKPKVALHATLAVRASRKSQ
jgi:hypothetical protein